MREETVLGDKWMRRAYLSPIRGALRWPLFGCGLFSRLMGKYLSSSLSRSRIEPTIRSLGIDLSPFEQPEGGWRSFNEFFARPLKPGARPLPESPSALISPADCRMTIYPMLEKGMVVPVKGASYTVAELLGGELAGAAHSFDGGSLVVCRLCPADYHRYHWIDNGHLLAYSRLRGKYHSVHPIALSQGYKVFCENLRTVSLLELDRGGRCAFVAVGAFGVASIHDLAHHPGKAFQRGECAGYFEFGGSTVILVFEPGQVRYDEKILRHSASGIETFVKVNSAIGEFLR